MSQEPTPNLMNLHGRPAQLLNIESVSDLSWAGDLVLRDNPTEQCVVRWGWEGPKLPTGASRWDGVVGVLEVKNEQVSLSVGEVDNHTVTYPDNTQLTFTDIKFNQEPQPNPLDGRHGKLSNIACLQAPADGGEGVCAARVTMPGTEVLSEDLYVYWKLNAEQLRTLCERFGDIRDVESGSVMFGQGPFWVNMGFRDDTPDRVGVDVRVEPYPLMRPPMKAKGTSTSPFRGVIDNIKITHRTAVDLGPGCSRYQGVLTVEDPNVVPQLMHVTWWMTHDQIKAFAGDYTVPHRMHVALSTDSGRMSIFDRKDRYTGVVVDIDVRSVQAEDFRENENENEELGRLTDRKTGQENQMNKDKDPIEITEYDHAFKVNEPKETTLLHTLEKLDLKEGDILVAKLGDPELGWIPGPEHESKIFDLLSQAIEHTKTKGVSLLLWNYALDLDIIHPRQGDIVVAKLGNESWSPGPEHVEKLDKRVREALPDGVDHVVKRKYAPCRGETSQVPTDIMKRLGAYYLAGLREAAHARKQNIAFAIQVLEQEVGGEWSNNSIAELLKVDPEDVNRARDWLEGDDLYADVD